MYQELAKSLAYFDSVEQKLCILRRYKRRETLRIGLSDLLKDGRCQDDNIGVE